MTTGSKGWLRWAGGALAVALIVVIVGVVMRRPASTPESQSAQAGSDSAIAIEQWRKDTFAGKDPQKVWDQYSQAAQAELSKPGVDPSDVKAKAATLGADPQKIFEFMRDEVPLEPYAGLLRGARGTLMANAGNALDRALLAQELLKANGIESRLVAGKLSDTQAASLLTRFLGNSKAPKGLADTLGGQNDAALTAEAGYLASKVGIPEDRVVDLLRQALKRGQDFWARTDAQRTTQFDFLSGELRKAGAKMAIDGTALTAKLKARLREHYWLQVKESDGTWSDFDPTTSDAKRGTAYGSQPVQLPEIPADAFHKLEFSLVYQSVKDGAPKEEVLIDGAFASADALFEPIEFRIEPTVVTTDPVALVKMDGKKKIELLRQIKRFQGVLRFGDKYTGGRSFDLDGNTYDAADKSLGAPGGTFFGDSLGGGEEPAPPQFVEVRVVMRLTGPDREPMSQTRTLVRAEDLLSPTFAPPLQEWEMLLQPQWLSAEFVGYRTLAQIVAVGNAVAEARRGVGAITTPQVPSAPLQLMQIALLRQTAAANIAVKAEGVRAFIDEPMLTIASNRLTKLDDSQGRIVAERSIDIVENSVRYAAGSVTSEAAAFDAALRQSVADCTIEDSFLRETYPGTQVESGTTILQKTRSESRPVAMIAPREADTLRSSGLTATDIEWIKANEQQSARLVVATAGSGPSAWWSVDPDGNAILRTSGGRGDALVERVLMEVKIGFAALCVMEFAITNEEYEHAGFITDNEYIKLAFCVGATMGSAGLVAGGMLFPGALTAFHIASIALIGAESFMAAYTSGH